MGSRDSGLKLVFLGCGGGRFSTITQRFPTGGFRLEAGLKLHIDPGPGALVRSHQLGLNPMDLDGVLITHAHPDHYTDAEVLIEAITRGGALKRGYLIANRTVLHGNQFGGPAISRYHRELISNLELSPDQNIELGCLNLQPVKLIHHDPESMGVKFHTPWGSLGYISDTQFFPELIQHYSGSRWLVICVTRPLDQKLKYHLCEQEAIQIISKLNPELAIITHFGMRMVEHPPEQVAARIQSSAGVRVIPAHPGLSIELVKPAGRKAAQSTLMEFGI